MNSQQTIVKASRAYTSDEDLLPALREGDNHAIRYVYQTYWPMIYHMVKQNSGGEAEAKDLYQDAMLDFLEKVGEGGFVLTCKIRTFIYSICRKKWLQRLRGRKSFVEVEEYMEFVDSPKEPIEEEPDLPNDLEIKRAIIALGEPCQTLLIGFYYGRKSMEQLAALLQYKSVSVAKQQKFRCKDRLRNALTARR